MNDVLVRVTQSPPVSVSVAVPNPASVCVSPGAGLGLSAYQIAVIHGYIGTEVEWLASLAGGAPVHIEAAEFLGGHRLVAVDANGLLVYADQSQPAAVYPVGVTMSAVVSGGRCPVVQFGIVEFSGWSFQPKEPVYLGLSGLFAQSAPETGWLVVVGVAVSATRLFLNIQEPIQL